MTTIYELARLVYDDLGQGYSEAVYHSAFEVLLRERSVQYETERIVPITFRGHVIGNVRCDIIINKQFIVELKSITKLRPCDRLQLENYLRLTGIQAGYLANFGPSLEVEEVSSPNTSQLPLENLLPNP